MIFRFLVQLSQRVLKWKPEPTACASAVGARSGGGIPAGVFNYKKGKWGKRLIFRNPKRQILSVMRQFETVDRQNSLALLSFVCQCAVCLTTKTETENDGRATSSNRGS